MTRLTLGVGVAVVDIVIITHRLNTVVRIAVVAVVVRASSILVVRVVMMSGSATCA